MKFILYLSKRILIFFVELIIPTAIAFASYKIIKLGIQPYNVGIRGIFNIIINQLPIIIFTCYTLSIILSIVLIDKTKINNLFILHVPPIIITFIILAIFFAFNSTGKSRKFFITPSKNVQVGINTFFKYDTFNNVGNRIVYINYKHNKLIYFLYDKSKNILISLKRISFTKENLILYPKNKHLSLHPIKISYKEVSKQPHFFKSNLISKYNLSLEKLAKYVKKSYYGLSKEDKLIFVSLFILSFIIFIVPLSFVINDGGWGITGLIGSVLILAIIPLLYNFIFTISATGFGHKNILSFLGRYRYLTCPATFLILGIIMDILIKLFRKAEV